MFVNVCVRSSSASSSLSRSRFPSKRIFRSNVFVCDRFYSPAAAAAQAAIVASEKRRKKIASSLVSLSLLLSRSLFPLKKEKKSSYVFFAYFLSSLCLCKERERSIALLSSLSLFESMRHVYVEHVYTRDRQSTEKSLLPSSTNDFLARYRSVSSLQSTNDSIRDAEKDRQREGGRGKERNEQYCFHDYTDQSRRATSNDC